MKTTKATKIYCRLLNGNEYYGFETNMVEKTIKISGVYTLEGMEKSGFFGEYREMSKKEISALLISIQAEVNRGYKLLPYEL